MPFYNQTANVDVDKPNRIASTPSVMSVFEALCQPPGAPDGDISKLVPRIVICLGNNPAEVIADASEGSLTINHPHASIQHVGLTFANACRLVPLLLQALSETTKRHGKWMTDKDREGMKQFRVHQVTTCTATNGSSVVYFDGEMLLVPVGLTVLDAITAKAGDNAIFVDHHMVYCEMESDDWPKKLEDVPGYDCRCEPGDEGCGNDDCC